MSWNQASSNHVGAIWLKWIIRSLKVWNSLQKQIPRHPDTWGTIFWYTL